MKGSIEFPDYAITGIWRLFVYFYLNHVGIPVSERQAKSSHSIVVLDDDEIECMRVTGKVIWYLKWKHIPVKF